MKNLKKVLALVLVCTMLLSLSVVAFAAYPDVPKDAVNAQAIETLTQLGIIKGDDNGKFNPDAGLTRAEAAKVMTMMMGSGELSKSPTSFTDVPADHWGSGYIASASASGTMVGYGDGKFGPEDKLTFEQVVKMIVVALGREPVAKEKNGYPEGYLNVGATVDLYKNATGSIGQVVTRKTVAQLLYNALDVPLMVQTVFSGVGGTAGYEIQDGKGTNEFLSIASKYLRAYKVKGVVTETPKTDSSMDLGTVDYDIDSNYNDDEFTSSDDQSEIVDRTGLAAGLLNYRTVAYLQEVDNEYEIVTIIAEAGKNITEKIASATDIQLVDSEIGSAITSDEGILAYKVNKDDSRSKKLDVDAEATIYFNGTPTGISFDSDDTLSDILQVNVDDEIMEQGSITLLDNDNNGIFDVLYLTSYIVKVIDDVEVDAKTIGTKDFDVIDLDKEDDSDFDYYTITLDGKAIAIKDLKEFDVLNIAIDYDATDLSDARFMEMVVTRKKITGTVTEQSMDGMDNYIDGKKYVVVQEVLSDELTPVVTVEAGDKGDFYLDMDGKIAFADTIDPTSNNYAYLVGFQEATTLDAAKLKVFDKTGALKTYELKNTVDYNGVLTKKAISSTATPTAWEAMEADIAAAITAGTAEETLVVLDFDKEQISGIDFAVNDATEDESFNIELNNAASKFFDKPTMRIGGLKVDNNTKIFVIPAQDEDDYEIQTVDSLVDNAEFINVTMFDGAKDTNIIGAIVVKEIENGLDSQTPLAIISGKTIVKNADDEMVYKLKFLENGKSAEAITDYDVVVTDNNFVPSVPPVAGENEVEIETLEIGDVISYEKSNGVVDKITLIGNITDDEFKLPTDLNDSKPLSNFLTYGEVTDKATGEITIDNSAELVANPNRLSSFDITNAKIYVYDANKSDAFKVSVGTATSIIKSTTRKPVYTLVRVADDNTVEIFVYKALEVN